MGTIIWRRCCFVLVKIRFCNFICSLQTHFPFFPDFYIIAWTPLLLNVFDVVRLLMCALCGWVCCGGNTLLFILIFCLALVIWVDFKSVLLFIWGSVVWIVNSSYYKPSVIKWLSVQVYKKYNNTCKIIWKQVSTHTSLIRGQQMTSGRVRIQYHWRKFPDVPHIPADRDAERSDPAAEPRRSRGSQDLLLQHSIIRREQNLQTRCAGHHTGGELFV